MSENEIHVADVGTTFSMTIYDGTSVVDISTSQTRKVKFKKPDGTKYSATATLTGTGSDGAMYYTVNTSTVLDQDGKWYLQAVVGFTGTTFHSDIYDFIVFPNIEAD